MITTFLCPTLLQNQDVDTPKKFEAEYISRLIQIKNLCEEHSKSTKKLKHSVERYKDRAPYDKFSEPTWKGYILDWQASIFPFLQKDMISLNEGQPDGACRSVGSLNEREAEVWSYLVEHIEEHTDDSCIPIILSTTACAKDSCSVDVVNKDNFSSELQYILYPWLRIVDSRLPPTGDRPYIPPKDWEKTGHVPRGLKNGYMDVAGEEWVHDTERNDHWDVQLKKGGHINVSYEGKVIS